jgi:hypothetical protein
MLQVVFHQFGMVVTSIVTNDPDPLSLWILGFDLFKQGDRRLGVDRLVIADNGTQIATVDDAIDVEPLPAGVTADFVGLTAFDPAKACNRIMVRMSGICLK